MYPKQNEVLRFKNMASLVTIHICVCVCVCIIGSGLYLKLHVYNYREIYISSTPFGEYTNSIVHKTFQKNIVIVVVKYLSNIMH